MRDNANLGAEGFADGARYHAARPRYPDAAVSYLVETLGIGPTSHVLDLGAGTGIFTAQLVAYGPRISAVEPARGMRDELAARLPSVEVLEGRDVDIPLASASVDSVVVAQAFHWFDAPAALEEIHRVLVDRGTLGLVWNERDSDVEWVRDLERAMRWPEGQPYEVGMDFTPVVAAGPFEDVRRSHFHFRDLLERESLLARVTTTSYIAVMGDDERRVLMDAVREVVDRLPDPVELPYVTTVYRATAVPRESVRGRGAL